LLSMGQLLGVLVLATAVPLLALALLMYHQMVGQQRDIVRDGLMNSARTLSALVDNEIDTHMAVAATLATSLALQSGALAAFRQQAKQALAIVPGAWLSLSDPTGRFVMTTVDNAADPLPQRESVALMEKAWTTGMPQVSDVITGLISKRRNAFIEYPVFKAGAPLYTIVVGLNPDRFQALIRDKFGQDATVGILDRQRNFVARVPDFENRVGTPAGKDWQAAIARAPAGLAEVVNLEGEPSITAYGPTRDGWIVGIAHLDQVFNAPVGRILWSMGLLAFALTSLSLTFGILLGRQLSLVMADLVTTAKRVGNGEIVTAGASIVREATAIKQALSEAAGELTNRQRALRDSEMRFRGTFDNAAVGVAHVGLDGQWIDVNQRLCQITGYSPAELKVRTFEDITCPNDLAAKRDNIRRILDGEIASYSIEQRYVRKDGSLVWVGVTVALQRDEAGAPRYFIKIVRDISRRKRAQEHQQFLLRELAHRMKNQLSIVQAVAYQTARVSSPDEFRQQFSQRLQGLAVSTDLLVAEDWTGASVSDLAQRQLQPFVPDRARLVCEGPDVILGPDAAQTIGLAFHELATNSLKHGAWSSSAGLVTLSWRLESDGAELPRLLINWLERSGPAVEEPARKGFGHMVLERMVAQKFDGAVEMKFDPQGLSWTVLVPATQLGRNATEGG
jgi:PAS domain S-box-containing protein